MAKLTKKQKKLAESVDITKLSSEFNTRPVRIPLFGLVNAAMFFARPAGARHIDLAVFEDLDPARSNPDRFEGMMKNVATGSWSPFVKVVSRRKGHEESTVLYFRQQGSDCNLLIATREPREATVIQLRLDSSAVDRWFREPSRCARTRGME